MKQIFTLFICLALIVAEAQEPSFKLKASNPTREYVELIGCMNGQYEIVQTARSPQYRDKGIITLYSPDHNQQAITNFQITGKDYNHIYYPMMSRNKITLFGAPADNLGSVQSDYVACWQGICKANVIAQDYNAKTLQKMGSPRIVPYMPNPKKYTRINIIHSLDGIYYATMESSYPGYNQIKYTLYKNDSMLYTVNLTLNGLSKPDGVVIDGKSLVMSSKGDVAFVYGNIPTNELGLFLVHISGETGKVTYLNPSVKGKVLARSPKIKFTDDGGILLSVTYGVIEKLIQNFTGVLVEKYSPTMELLQHAELPFSSETISKCSAAETGKIDGVMFMQFVKDIFPMNNGYVIVTDQESWQLVNQTYDKYTYNNVVCFGLTSDFKQLYQKVVRTIDKKSRFIIDKEIGAYASDNKVYIFHGGDDDKIKNTKDEFSLFCTWWENGPDPVLHKVEIPRPYSDLNINPLRYCVFEKNKLLFKAQSKGGDVWTTMEITL